MKTKCWLATDSVLKDCNKFIDLQPLFRHICSEIGAQL